jgi:pimeloyl-ACP methyl ester carboxylesterase
MQVGMKGAYDCIKAFSETDFTEDLKKIDVPTLVAQGDNDQIVPFDDASALTAQIVKDSTLRVYPGAPHGLANTPAGLRARAQIRAEAHRLLRIGDPRASRYAAARPACRA